MNISIAREQDRVAWNQFVFNSPKSSIYHLKNWQDIIEKSYKNKTYYLMAREGNQIIDILPMVFIRNILTGNSLTSLPYVNYGGFCSDNPLAHEMLMQEAAEIAHTLDAKYVEIRETQELPGFPYPSKQEKVTLQIALPSNADTLWKQLDPKVRNQVRKATRASISFKLGGLDYLDLFYPVFLRNMRDLGSPGHSYAFFKEIFLTFPEQTKIACLFLGDKVIGGAILLSYKDRMEVPWASSLRKYFHYCPNNLLYWEILKYTCEQKIPIFDFGRSTMNSGPYKFKMQWGAQPKQLFWYYYLNGDKAVPQSSKKMLFISNIWKQLPCILTGNLGPVLRKHLPA
jgi:serine/alanine adding enzyme